MKTETGRDILFVYPTGKNKEFIKKIAKKKNQTVSFIINYLIENFKANKEMQQGIAKHIPAAVKKSRETLSLWEAKQELDSAE